MLIPSALASLIVNAELLYCGYLSFKALESERNSDDTRWLTFWFVYTLFAFGKSIVDYVAFVIPFYTEAHIAIVTYMAFLGGANVAYGILRPILKQHEAIIDQKIAEAKDVVTELQAEGVDKAKEYADEAMKMAQNQMLEAMKNKEE